MRGYLSPNQTLKIYGKRNGGAFALKLRLADDLRSGRLEAKARFLWKTRTKSFKEAMREKNKSQRDPNRPVPVHPLHWSGSRSTWARDQETWDWDNNKFVVTTRSDEGKERTFIFGVFFPISRLNQLLISTQKLHDIENMVNKVGNPGSEHWDELWLQLIDLAKAGKLSSDEYKSRNALVKELDRRLRGQMSRPTIRRKLDQNFTRLISDLTEW